ncbi:H-NS family nucleoid-associated regulatory protein [Crenothrix polyspora]|jgi:DNA-binding protein H-NS|uniref:Histone family protein nucleoid-structuring protein H-NS n=1 Tax=Crenothrix polyspora TaxID=360316 RepID=A0A1R4HC80_9GAMM|nr:H-NS histone family protein [Crenothrix polyspora]SJM93845.1 Histone family protein nucleoid-structuring protein H-NS [Crenothrix polyspora]
MLDFQKMSEKELKDIIENAEKALRNLHVNRRKDVMAQMKELAASINVSVEIVETDKKSLVRKGNPVPVKYCHPDDAEKTWTGRGVMPTWLRALVDAGHDRSEFLIQPVINA